MMLIDWVVRARANQVNAGLGKWRSRALQAMYDVVGKILADSGGWTSDMPGGKTILAAVDAAYPFGPRSNFPYKAWLEERRILVDALLNPTPSKDEFEVCQVAADLVEEERIDEAKAMLEEQAPNRLGRKCPSCGVPRGTPCKEPDINSVGPLFGHSPRFLERVVPHVARVQPQEE